jgi:hypothetical protein
MYMIAVPLGPLWYNFHLHHAVGEAARSIAVSRHIRNVEIVSDGKYLNIPDPDPNRNPNRLKYRTMDISSKGLDVSDADMIPAFIAKDRSTLISALSICPPDVRITCKNNEQIGYALGSYDYEKFGDSIRNKIHGLTNKKKHKEQSLMSYSSRINQDRLIDRGYFLVAARAVGMRRYKGHVSLINNEISFRALASFIKNG